MGAYHVPFDVPVWDYDHALSVLHSTLRLGICPLLETVEDMLSELANPDLAFDCLQVAGTNGKTSTSRYTAAILAGEGYKVALYTSPELVSYTERMEISGKPVAEKSFAHGLAAAVEAGRRVNERRERQQLRPYDITEFDLLTVAAMVIFAEAGVDIAVLEVGMGGRWDATSAAKSIKAVAVTGIGLDHMRILGDTLEAIAAEKAAVIKAGRACVLGVGTATPHSVEDVFLQQAEQEGVTPVILRAERLADAEPVMHPGTPREHEGLPRASFTVDAHPSRLGGPLQLTVNTRRASYSGLGALKPSYQAPNIACAVALAEEYLGRALNAEALFESVVSCPTPGRFDLVRSNPPALIDACHNPQSVEAFLTAVRAVAPSVKTRPTLLCAVLADKDVAGIVSLLAHEFPAVVCTQTSSPRALPADELAREFRAQGVEPKATYPQLSEAVAALENDAFVACGSITTAGEVAALFGR
ncbi:MAG: Mur ligase family protein [Coriobacteriales bacterium]|nr:Mur ligase family protein [Coriobacteriales bacterium]